MRTRSGSHLFPTLCAEFDRGTTLTTKDGLELSANRRHTRLFERLCRDYLELVDLF